MEISLKDKYLRKSELASEIELLKGPFLVLHFSYYTVMTIICNTAIYADYITLYSKCDQAFDLWQ